MQKNRSSRPASSKSDDVERRLIVLEERLAFAEHTLDNLGGVITAVHAQLDRLESETKKLQTHVERLSELGLGDDLSREKPPHY